MASAVVTSLPGQQPIEQPINDIPQAAVSSTGSNANWHSSSGSIGPFFGVISVLTVLAILSCILGRVCSRRAEAAVGGGGPVGAIKHRDYFGWMKRKSRWCRGGDVEVGAKVMALDQEKQDCKAQP
ncbi:uncharacterized protein LOC8264556 [Ricinus communis]|uniref:Uncharacterized protein n=1 Tax=Ricinus communis TaxID=3988 RepID=B9RE63_RICCO|nr:uncharacterized protein LOC8264556 [Ricinus communis]EEF50671.1 conserved hypothetical protein [Ricinus communis]|eukprot:XP_002512002.1 uncharacterized protein LOC8264556 [Ricinus communis]